MMQTHLLTLNTVMMQTTHRDQYYFNKRTWSNAITCV